MRHIPHGYERDFADWLFPLLIIILLAALVFIVFRLARRSPIAAGGEPLQRAAARYASGEIERVEFERIQRDLTASTAATTPLEDAALRLARGEITTAEFDTIKGRLGGEET